MQNNKMQYIQEEEGKKESKGKQDEREGGGGANTYIGDLKTQCVQQASIQPLPLLWAYFA